MAAKIYAVCKYEEVKLNRHRDESSNILSLCLFFCDLSGNPVKFCQTVFVEFTGIPAYNDR